jgi:hypothetical protein
VLWEVSDSSVGAAAHGPERREQIRAQALAFLAVVALMMALTVMAAG